MEKIERAAGRRKARILLVDDHPIIRHGISETLSFERDLEVCGEAGDAATARRQMSATRPDLAVIDLSLGMDSGLDLIKETRLRHPEIKVLVLSMHDDSLYAERSLRAGALGYLNKSEPGDTLIKAIRTVLAGKTYLAPHITDHLVRRAVEGQPVAGAGILSLSDRELQVFELLGRGLSIRDIAQKLCLSIKTVESHREHVKAKLNIEKSTELVRRAAVWMEGHRDL